MRSAPHHYAHDVFIRAIQAAPPLHNASVSQAALPCPSGERVLNGPHQKEANEEDP
ncbi:hypothetical protein HYPSUDRAFT_208706 [Hypholoma sublateritium FD-334 SS-4]|uniref:Uncharacterized protein n=1 Tax=Hypholoma sublateritium (strain FD-334 SS-4) TaxID=945553 RepID=A0A0D2KEK6_HYPSF|nr:hypothetical protein HYPSUDRAFT_209964 [Hypholoma sublateritium FD-334 SS-4]KJA14436.1 hypothetical protein HYPSUDRAFT_208706 [Hypholoma sublateritium FD-334 SS-4]